MIDKQKDYISGDDKNYRMHTRTNTNITLHERSCFGNLTQRGSADLPLSLYKFAHAVHSYFKLGICVQLQSRLMEIESI